MKKKVFNLHRNSDDCGHLYRKLLCFFLSCINEQFY